MYIKFIIWGAGFRGKKLLLCMGKQRIVAFVDSDKELVGTAINEVPVVSFEEYEKKYKEYPIIITPALFFDDIKKKLENSNIYNSLPFSFDIESWFMQLDKNRYFAKYKTTDSICIIGKTVLGLMVYEYLRNHKYQNCELFTKEEKTVKFDYLIITEKKYDIKNFVVNKDIVEMYGLSLQKSLFVNTELKRFKNIHMGDRIFLVATGPSLLIDDLNKLWKKHEYCMSFNGIFNAFDKTEWRPNYYDVNDPDVGLRWKDSIKKLQCEAKFVADVSWYYEQGENLDKVYRWHLFREDLRNKLNGDSEFSEDFSQGIYGGTTVVYSGIQIAIYMGFKEIYLLGTDCNYSYRAPSTHFYSDCKEERQNPNQENEGKKMIHDYEIAKKYADSHGIKIYNATRGGMLEVFERVNFDNLFLRKD